MQSAASSPIPLGLASHYTGTLRKHHQTSSVAEAGRVVHEAMLHWLLCII